jgi:putative ABC transport system permease protein
MVSADLRYAARTLRASPGFSLSAIAILALGIGAAAAIFSVVNKVLLEPLPYPEPDRLVQLKSESWVGDQNVVSVQKFLVWRDFTVVFQHIAAYETGGPSLNLTDRDQPEPLKAARVSAGYFAVFGAPLALGRSFSAAEDAPRGSCAVLLTNRLWHRRFAGDPTVLGRKIPLEGAACQVVGVLEPNAAAEPVADIFLPLQADPKADDHVSRVRVAARLKAGYTLDDARKAVAGTMRHYLYRYSWTLLLFHEDFTAIGLRDAIVGDVRPALYLLTGAVAFVLLICCANLANLLLARGARRARELAIRTALGAERRRIIRQLLTESVLLALAGGGAGLVIGLFAVRGVFALSPAEIPRIGASGAAITLDWRVFLFTLLVSLATAIVFGLFPALKASRADVSSLVNESDAQSGMGFHRNRGRGALVIAEVSLALVLLAGAGLLIRTFVAARTVDRGFSDQNILTLETSLANPRFDRTLQVDQLVRSATRRLRLIPGVDTVATTSALPLEPSLTLPFTVHNQDQTQVGRYHGAASWRSVSPEYFHALQIRLLRGRPFTDRDDGSAARVVLINRAMFKKYWQDVDANPIGDFITVGKGMGAESEDEPRQIIGVVADVREAGLGREPMMYVPASQLPDSINARNNRLLPLTWVVHTQGPSAAASAAVLRELRESTGGLTVQRVRTLHEVVSASAARTRFYTMVLSLFAAIALLLAAAGLYALMAYAVQQRTREIGIRMALGASPEDVRNMVIWQGMRLALLGIALGVPTALALTRVMDSMIFGVRPWDPAVFGVVAALLAAVTFCAAWAPSRVATRVDPAGALRSAR